LIPFIESGSPALAHRVAEAIGRSGHAVLIRNHGFFAVGRSLAEAFYTADELQDALRVYVFSSGQAVALPLEVCDRIRAAHRDGPVRNGSDAKQHDAEKSRP
jgi:ribulose-5-phosphate 4-epimerase/fuculose-1-phosphate aldolase